MVALRCWRTRAPSWQETAPWPAVTQSGTTRQAAVPLREGRGVPEPDRADVPLSTAGVRARGNAKILKVNHHCSREINTFSRRFLWGDAEEGTTIRVGDQSAIVPVSSDRPGERVEVRRCADVLEQATWAAARCQDLASQGWTPDEMAVLYASPHVNALGAPVARDAADGIDLVALLQAAFREAQVPLHWLSRDRGTKADAVLDHGGVALTTVHSFKGLESRVVVLFGMDRPRAGAAARPQGKALLYVGMTRATHRLLVPCQCTSDGLIA